MARPPSYGPALVACEIEIALLTACLGGAAALWLIVSAQGEALISPALDLLLEPLGIDLTSSEPGDAGLWALALFTFLAATDSLGAALALGGAIWAAAVWFRQPGRRLPGGLRRR